jgi:hypothetical protein
MYLERKLDTSFYYWVKDKFSSYPSVNVVDDFPHEEFSLPAIAIVSKTITEEDFELGNRSGLQEWVWYVEIFANTKTQRDEFCYRIFNELKDGIPVYNYDEGFETPSRIGTLKATQKRIDFIQIFPELTENLYYRATVTVVAEYDQKS